MELEDDVFFADLSKQIALLISEDDEDKIPGQEFPIHYFPVPVQGYAHFPQMMMPPIYAYEYACRRESRGTGVFIPKSSLPRRKIKQMKPNSTATNCQTKPFDRTVSRISEISSTNDGCNHSNHIKYNKSGGMKKLNI